MTTTTEESTASARPMTRPASTYSFCQSPQSASESGSFLSVNDRTGGSDENSNGSPTVVKRWAGPLKASKSVDGYIELLSEASLAASTSSTENEDASSFHQDNDKPQEESTAGAQTSSGNSGQATSSSFKGGEYLYLPKNLQGVELYALLDLPKFCDDIELIKKQYKKACLNWHPDKLHGSMSDDEINVGFMKVKAAFDILIDERHRGAYNRTLYSTDEMPTEEDVSGWVKAGPEVFYEKFGSLFDRNSVWSKKKPVPTFGDMSTPTAEVTKFYAFWRTFQSARHFLDDQLSTEMQNASSREERRYLQKENKRLSSELYKKETTRILKLVNLAYSNDFRRCVSAGSTSTDAEKASVANTVNFNPSSLPKLTPLQQRQLDVRTAKFYKSLLATVFTPATVKLIEGCSAWNSKNSSKNHEAIAGIIVAAYRPLEGYASASAILNNQLDTAADGNASLCTNLISKIAEHKQDVVTLVTKSLLLNPAQIKFTDAIEHR